MSRRFSVIALFVTTRPAATVDHDGKHYVNDAFPVGTTLCLDIEGDLFVDTGRYPMSPKEWADTSPKKQKYQRLFRDYWKFVTDRDHLGKTDAQLSPYNRALLSAGLKLVWGRDNFELVDRSNK